MNKLWNNYSVKFLAITAREKYLILLSGLVAVTFILFTLFIDANLIEAENLGKRIKDIKSKNNSAQTTINILKQSLSKDPNVSVNKKITQYDKKISKLDDDLLLLTSDLISPIQMRFALIDLLKTQHAVSLISFEVIPAEPLVTERNSDIPNDSKDKESLTLYKHAIKLTLTGSYFQLRDYLKQLEQLKWTFFWHEFEYELMEYPAGELKIEMYSLSTEKEFIGV